MVIYWQRKSLYYTNVCEWLVAQLCLILCDPMDCSPAGPSVHGDSPGKNTRVGCHALLQGIFPTQGSNPGLPHCNWIFCHLSHQASPRILEWAAYPFSRDLPDPGIKLASPALQPDSLPTELPMKPLLLIYDGNFWLGKKTGRENWCDMSTLEQYFLILGFLIYFITQFFNVLKYRWCACAC